MTTTQGPCEHVAQCATYPCQRCSGRTKTCVDCSAPATSTFDEWRGDWGAATLPVCETHEATRRAANARPRPFGAGL